MINVALTTDRNYLNYALATTASILHKTRNHTIRLYVLHEELDDNDFARFRPLSKIKPFELEPLKISAGFFKNWPPMRWSMSAYYRLLLPDLLPETDKLIYLDCDLLVLDDLSELWNIDLGSAPCGAVATKVSHEHKNKIGLPEEAAYFNAGVMVYNLRKMAQEKHTGRFIALFNEYADRIKYADQDILNLCYHDCYHKLPLRWNVVNSIYRNPPDETLYSQRETTGALHSPGIVHFTGTHKPWRLLKTTHHPYTFCFRYFAGMAELPLPLRAKLVVKALTTGRLKKSKKATPWGKSIIDRNIIKKA